MINNTDKQTAPKRKKYDTVMSAEEVLRQNRREIIKDWLEYIGYAILVILFDAFIYYGVWILLGLYIQNSR